MKKLHKKELMQLIEIYLDKFKLVHKLSSKCIQNIDYFMNTKILLRTMIDNIEWDVENEIIDNIKCLKIDNKNEIYLEFITPSKEIFTLP